MRKTFIYALTLEGDPTIRYVGKADNPELRVRRHIYNTKHKIKYGKSLTHKDYWLIKNDFMVSYVILDECDYSVWREREIFHINNHINLTNTSSGGLGGCGITYQLSYNEAKIWVKENLGLTSKRKWVLYVKNNKLPDFISPYPYNVYKNRGWVSWGDFLGTGNKWDNDVDYIDYLEAKEVLKPLKIKNSTLYREMFKGCNIPYGIPLKPNRYYKNRGWVSWGDFLGSGFIANQLRQFYPYEEFKAKVTELKLETYSDYKKYVRNKHNTKLPTNPNLVYKNHGWVGWSSVIT
jgi:hypothetical protein